MTEKQPAARKEIGDVAMGYDDDAGNAGIVRTRKVTFDQPGQELALEGGGALAPFTLAYETYGTLSERKDARHPCALGGRPRSRAPQCQRQAPRLVGHDDRSGKGLDTDKYFVICANVIGGSAEAPGGWLGEEPRDGWPCTDFPMTTIRDMVNADVAVGRPGHRQAAGRRRRLDGRHAGPHRPTTPRPHPPSRTAGYRGSPADHGDRLQRRRPAGDHGRRQPARRALLWRQGAGQGAERGAHGRAHHVPATRRWRRSSAAACRTSTTTRSRSADFEVESYLRHQGLSFTNRFDANTLLYITRALDYFDLTRQHGTLVEAFADVKARFLVNGASAATGCTRPTSSRGSSAPCARRTST